MRKTSDLTFGLSIFTYANMNVHMYTHAQIHTHTLFF